MARIARKILKWLGLALFFGAVAVLALLLLGAFQARGMAALQPWHSASAWADTLTQQEYTNFAEYLAAEKTLLDAIYQAQASSAPTILNRYTPASLYSPYVAGENLNGSFQLFPTGEMKGGALLLHGLSDSPYYLRAVATVLADQGYYVIALRLPGHGTTPGALTTVQWQEWVQATQFGAMMVQRQIDKLPSSRFLIGGFSLGGTLALHYTLEALHTGVQRTPDKILLFAPAIGVDGSAALARWTKLVSWIPYFQQFGWTDIMPEYDPFKYASFSMNAADQIYQLMQANNALSAQVAQQPDGLAHMPPILAFQSVVDATVSTDALFDWFAHYGTPTSELVLFDFNRTFAPFVRQAVQDAHPTDILQQPGFQARLVVVTNQPASTLSSTADLVTATLYAPGADGAFAGQAISTTLVLRWPATMSALAHVALLIAPEDQSYGRNANIPLFNAKGESGMLAISDFNMLRERYNPFFAFMAERIAQAVAE